MLVKFIYSEKNYNQFVDTKINHVFMFRRSIIVENTTSFRVNLLKKIRDKKLAYKALLVSAFTTWNINVSYIFAFSAIICLSVA